MTTTEKPHTNKPPAEIVGMLDSGHTLRDIEDRLDWLENQAEDEAQRTQAGPDGELVTEVR